MKGMAFSKKDAVVWIDLVPNKLLGPTSFP